MADPTQREPQDTLPSPDDLPNPHEEEAEGEGNVEADRRYRAGVARTIASGRVEELAKEAEEALDGPEGEALRRAEERGTAGRSGA